MKLRTEYRLGKHYGAAVWWKVFLDDVFIGSVDRVRPKTYFCCYKNGLKIGVKTTKEEAFACLERFYNKQLDNKR